MIARIPGTDQGRAPLLVDLGGSSPGDRTSTDGALGPENRLYGRGAVDMKGPVATVLLTLAAFARTGRCSRWRSLFCRSPRGGDQQ